MYLVYPGSSVFTDGVFLKRIWVVLPSFLLPSFLTYKKMMGIDGISVKWGVGSERAKDGRCDENQFFYFSKKVFFFLLCSFINRINEKRN